MDGDRPGNLDPTPGWPAWARRLASALILFHGLAILAGVMGQPPASELERRLADGFQPYNEAIHQGVSYRYYSPEPPPTPVVTATLRFRDGRPDQSVRIPERGTWPRMLYQRQLNLAHWLIDDVENARRDGGDPGKSRWAGAYAAHLGRTHPGCSSVRLDRQLHLIPPLERVHDRLDRGEPVDLDADEFYTVPERIGDFPCDAS